ncbi:CBS domain-containing protein [Phyllobacterium zundukense]|uniref:Inosine-5-monophosphate dehydrogenase n=1 Tax=Phyllobacterium zundukense TaxID=1867719 RepID=A0A2N9VUJ5_9HYPH|nr:CBS domain-containing protein [Phyllobacterium zundukense]ATU94997.1 inosine-5-monophosphate dehydrogenase [Phyllobacterium zundukense]PIO43163.1 inosine-5-monophosphate dehydrogenase [Phyllobacterium zundukense]
MKVSEAMHRGVNWVAPDASLAQIAKIMKNDDVGAVPVGENDRLIGMVTDRDIALRALAGDRDTASLTARDVLTKGVVYCRTDETVENAVRLMESKQIRRLPVIDDNKRMVGMLSVGDISHHSGRELMGELMAAVTASHP